MAKAASEGRNDNDSEPPSEPPALLTAAERIKYLRRDVDERDPAERLRNFVRGATPAADPTRRAATIPVGSTEVARRRL